MRMQIVKGCHSVNFSEGLLYFKRRSVYFATVVSHCNLWHYNTWIGVEHKYTYINARAKCLVNV